MNSFNGTPAAEIKKRGLLQNLSVAWGTCWVHQRIGCDAGT